MFSLLLLGSVAFADAPAPGVPFRWTWPAEATWHVSSTLLTPRGVRYHARDNLDARAGAIGARGDLACTYTPSGTSVKARCRFVWLELAGQALLASEQATLDTVLAEWRDALPQAELAWTVGADGRMRAFDVKAREQVNRRDAYVIEAQRSYLQRLVAPFDLPLPDDAKDWVRGWRHSGDNAVLRLQTISGTAGAADVRRRRESDRDGLVVVVDEGRASLAPGGAVDSAGTRIIDVQVAGESLLDPVTGTLVWRSFTLDGRLTASSQATGSDVESWQTGSVQWITVAGAPGTDPLSVAAQRAPRLPGTAPATTRALVSFSELGMAPLFVQGFPQEATPLGLPVTPVRARVEVDEAGTVASVAAWEGFAVLGAPTEHALRAARFPAQSAAYAVDVVVEWRPAPVVAP
jgi:hypothetical protein